MKDIELRGHGAHVGIDPARPGIDLDKAPPPGQETVEEYATGVITTRRYAKGERTAATPRSMGRIRQVHAHAIELTGVPRKTGGSGLTAAVLLGLPLLLAGAWLLTFNDYLHTATPWLAVLLWLGATGFCLVCGAGLFLEMLNRELFVPEDLPVLFDRKHRKVYRLVQDARSEYFNLFWPRPLVACEYDWDLIDVQYRRHQDFESPVRDDHSLVFRVLRGHDNAQVIDSFDITEHALGEGNLDPLWEHIRRFMEEGGPHLAHRGEVPALPPVPRSWWQRLGMEGESRPLFLIFRGQSLPKDIVCLCLFLLGLPFRLLNGIGEYLGMKTALRVRWPVVVQERIGPPLPGPAGEGAGRAARGA